MKKLIALLLITATVCWSQADKFVTILVNYSTETSIDEGTGQTNDTYTFIYQVPLPIGQSQNSKTYSGTNPPSAMTVSNDIARDIPGLLSWMGTINPTNVTIKMPGGLLP